MQSICRDLLYLHSFWQGGVFPILQMLEKRRIEAARAAGTWAPSALNQRPPGAGGGQALPEVPGLPPDLIVRTPTEQANAVFVAKSSAAMLIVAQATEVKNEFRSLGICTWQIGVPFFPL